MADRSTTLLRWGILSAGKISHDFVLALLTLPATEHKVVAVGARSRDTANAFAKKFGIARSYGSYEEVAKDPDVDVIYIGAISSLHKELSIMCLQNGKAVLCEKPATVNPAQLTEVLEMASKTQTFYMEALWTRCCPLYRDLLARIQKGDIGEVCAVTCCFGIEDLIKVERIKNMSLGGGILLDIGIYTLTFADLMFNGQQALSVHAVGHKNEDGLDHTISITLLYPNNKIAQLLISGGFNLSNEGVVIGSRGLIKVEKPFWMPEKFSINGEEVNYPLPETFFPVNFPNSSGLRYEAMHVRQCLIAGQLESDVASHAVTERITNYMATIQELLNK